MPINLIPFLPHEALHCPQDAVGNMKSCHTPKIEQLKFIRLQKWWEQNWKQNWTKLFWNKIQKKRTIVFSSISPQVAALIKTSSRHLCRVSIPIQTFSSFSSTDFQLQQPEVGKISGRGLNKQKCQAHSAFYLSQ